MASIDPIPAQPPSYSPADERYWESGDLRSEIERTFDICNGCRLCFKLCGSFPVLFEAMDRHEDDATKVTDAEVRHIDDLCFGCKLCYVKCPYTKDDAHEYDLDFPALILRMRAQRVREEGLPLRERILSDPVALGTAAGLAPVLANRADQSPLLRGLLERTLGVHRDKSLPPFASETFEEWERRQPRRPDPPEPTAKVALFHTCYVNYNRPAIGRAALRVLRRNGCAVKSPEQTCCGMPAMDAGDVDTARRRAEQNVRSLLPLVRDGWRVAGINPTCSMMLRKEYPRLLDTDEAREVADAVVDTHEVLFDLKREGHLDRSFLSSPGVIAWHVPCHLKALGRGFRSRDVMRLIEGAKITTVDHCSGHDGTWSMKKENFEQSMAIGEEAFDGVRGAEADVVAADCPLAGLQIAQATGAEPLHPLEIIDRAYSPDGFPTPIIEDEPTEPDENEE